MMKKQRPTVGMHGKKPHPKSDPLNPTFTQVLILEAIGSHGGL